MKPYLIIFGYDVGNRQAIQEYIDTIEDIDDWCACLPQAIFCVSSLEAHDIAEKMKEYCGRKQFFVMECHPHRQGWLPRRAWEFMRTPEHFSLKKPRESSI